MVKSIDEFYASSKSKDGHRSYCKICENAQIKKWQISNHEKLLGYYKKHHDKYREIDRKYRREYESRDKVRTRKNERQREAYKQNKEKYKKYRDKYRVEHREELLTKKRAYYWAHREERATKNREWREENRATLLKKKRDYSRSHPEIGFLHTQRRRAQQRASAFKPITRAQWEEIKHLYGYRCVYCGRKMKHLQQDHVIPLASGGPHTANNIVPACPKCNARKGTRRATIFQPILLDLVSAR